MLAVALGCSQAAGSGPELAPAAAPGPADERAVYAGILDTILAWWPSDTLAVLDRPIAPEFPDSAARARFERRRLRRFLPGLEPATVSDFRARVGAPAAALPEWREAVPLGAHVRWQSEADRTDLYWPPGRTLVSLSRVGFDPARTQALAYVQFHCGGLCGHGLYVLLAPRADGRWRVRKLWALWST